MAKKKAAPADVSKEKTAPDVKIKEEKVKVEIIVPMVELGQMELYRGWKGLLPDSLAEKLVKLDFARIIGV